MTNTRDQIAIAPDAALDGTDIPPRLSTFAAEAVLAGDVVTRATDITAAYSIDDDDHVIFVDTSGGAVTVTLLDATLYPGREFVIKKTTADANAITIASDGGDVEADTTHVFGANVRDSRVVKSDGTDWWIRAAWDTNASKAGVGGGDSFMEWAGL